MQLGGLGSAVNSPSGSGAKSQPTKDLGHIEGQNNSSRSNIFGGFAVEKIQHFAKLSPLSAQIWLYQRQVRTETKRPFQVATN